jgi:acyl carrier protein phosphodiesterase
MNYLAHLYLAGDAPEAIVGNLMGDFVKGSALSEYSEPIRAGIRLHRRIDAFTDAHPVVAGSRRLIGPEHRRYAGVLVDIFYDHFLARSWAAYSSVPLPEFAARVYQVLRTHDRLLPDRLRRVAASMSANDWLGSYAEVVGIEAALARAARRLTRENAMAAGAAELTANYDGLRAHFDCFFPALVQYVRGLRQQH